MSKITIGSGMVTISNVKNGAKGDPGTNGIAFYGPSEPSGDDVTEGSTWFKTVSDTDLSILSINTFKSGSWEATPIADSAISVDSLSALSATLGDVTAGTLTGVTITGSTVQSPFDTKVVEDGTDHRVGISKMASGAFRTDYTQYGTDGTTDKTGSGFYQLGDKGLTGTIYDKDGKAANNFSFNSAALSMNDIANGFSGALTAQLLQSITQVKTASFTMSGSTHYKNGTIVYYRWGQIVVAVLGFDLLDDVGWVDFSSGTVGYRPADWKMGAAVLASTSHRGWTCSVYYNSYGWRLIPTKGQGADTFQGAIPYFTNDAWPKS